MTPFNFHSNPNVANIIETRPDFNFLRVAIKPFQCTLLFSLLLAHWDNSYFLAVILNRWSRKRSDTEYLSGVGLSALGLKQWLADKLSGKLCLIKPILSYLLTLFHMIFSSSNARKQPQIFTFRRQISQYTQAFAAYQSTCLTSMPFLTMMA